MTPEQQAAVDEFMRAITRGISAVLKEHTDGAHFLLLVFKDDVDAPEGGRVNYISDVLRDDAKAAMKELIARWEGQPLKGGRA